MHNISNPVHMAATSSSNSRTPIDYHGASSMMHGMSNPYLSSFPSPCSPTLAMITSVPQSSVACISLPSSSTNRRRRTFGP
ncbi:hypothetical protein M405DRAFT_409482 [Rhizopogon salebrosus TDB-379]|nr:hypothetical protein M405DRAFT_409482 [Rhizopogon salebrosus TDB-379]